MNHDEKQKLDLVSAEMISLMKKHGLIQLGWNFQFDNAKVRFGCCMIGRKILTLSKRLVVLNFDKNMWQITDTMLHEIAHALCMVRYGVAFGHDWRWYQIAIEIGCSGQSRYDGDKVIEAEKKYVYKCPNCGKEMQRCKATTKKTACGDCCRKYSFGKYDPKYRFVLVMVDGKPVKQDAEEEILATYKTRKRRSKSSYYTEWERQLLAEIKKKLSNV